MVNFSYVLNSKDEAAKKVSLESFEAILEWFGKYKSKAKDGVAIISGCFSEQRRKLQFAEFADIIMFDVDAEGLSFNEAVAKLRELNLESILYTSFSHGTTKGGLSGDRYRIIFNLLNPIIAQDYKALWLGLENYLSELGFRCDKSCKDITRLMFTPRLKNPESTKEPRIEYIKGFRLEPEFYRIRGAAKIAYKGDFKINPSVLVTDSVKAKVIQALKFVPPRREGTGTYHETLAVASALKTVFGVDQGYLACEIWSPGFKSLDAFSQLPSAFTVSTIFFYAKQNGWKDELSVTREVDKRYLEANDVLSDKSVCVTISPQGTGKTEAISKALEGEDKVLLVGHRRNLIKQASKRLNLSCYLEESYTSSKASRVGICLDSILKTKKQAIGGTLVIDEWTQVLRHITGSTLKRKRAAVLAFFVDILKASTKIILLDAIADESLLNLLLSFSNKTLEDTEITRNNYALLGQNRVVDFKRSKDDLISSIIAACENGEKFAVATDSKADADSIVQVIKKAYNYTVSEGKDNADLKCLLVTSDTSKNTEANEFINNADKHCDLLDVLVYTPAISTGVDIQSKRFTKVFGVFTGVLAAPDIVQSLRRVRNTEKIELHITPAAWTPDISDLEACLVASGSFLNWPKHELPSSAYAWVAVNSKGELVYRDEGYVYLLKAIFEHERKFKLSLANQVAKMLSSQGFDCESVLLRPTDSERSEARLEMNEAKFMVGLAKVQATMESTAIDLFTAKTVLHDSTADVETKRQALFTAASEVTKNRELIEMVVSNELTTNTLTAQASLNLAEVFRTKPNVEDELNERKRQDVDNYKLKFLKFGIYGELLNSLGGFDSTTLYDQTKTAEIIAVITKYAKPLQWIFKLDLRNVATARPRATVNKVFKRVFGCTFERVQRRVNGAVTSFFRLSNAEAEVIEAYLKREGIDPKAVIDFSWVKEANEAALEDAKVKTYDKFGILREDESSNPEETQTNLEL